MKIKLAFIIICCCNLGYAQLIHLLDSVNGDPVIYSHILFYSGDQLLDGTYSDEKGVARLELSENVSHVKFSSLGYAPKKMDRLNLPDTVKLVATSEMLAMVEVIPSDLNQPYSTWGYAPLKTVSYLVLPGFQLIAPISNPEEKELPIRSFIFQVKKLKSKDTPVAKVILFENVDGMPGDQIGSEVIYEIDKDAGRKQEVFLNPLVHRLKPEGIYIGIEWIGCSSKQDGELYKCNPAVVCNRNTEVPPAVVTYFRPVFLHHQWIDIFGHPDMNLTPVYSITTLDKLK